MVHNYIHSANFLFVFRGSVIYPKLEEPLNDYSFTLINNLPKKITIVSLIFHNGNVSFIFLKVSDRSNQLIVRSTLYGLVASILVSEVILELHS